MKMNILSPGNRGESVIRPGFDVLLAVTGARQATSPTARRVAATRDDAASADRSGQRRALLARGHADTGAHGPSLARFADLAPTPALSDVAVEGLETEINGLFTRAFQSMVKHPPVNGLDKTGDLGGAGSGMK